MRILKLLSLTVSLLLFSGLIAYAGDESDKKQSNAQILQDLIVIDQNELLAAQLATEKADNAKVKEYAVLLLKEHQANLEKTTALAKKINSTPQGSDLSQELQNMGEKTLNQLKTVTKGKFDKAYLQVMITSHKKALNLLDQFIKDSTNEQLTNHLQETRQHVAMHLAKAQELQKKSDDYHKNAS